MQTVKQGQLTLALLSRIPPLLRIYCLLLHWGFYTKPKKLLPVSTIFNIFLAVEWAFFFLSPPPLCLFTLLELHTRTEQWSVLLLGLFILPELSSQTFAVIKPAWLKKKTPKPKPNNLRAGKKMGILRERVRGQRVYSHSPAWDSAWTGWIAGSVDVDVCGWGRKRLRNPLENFSICQLFPLLEWATVPSLRQLYQEM